MSVTNQQPRPPPPSPSIAVATGSGSGADVQHHQQQSPLNTKRFRDFAAKILKRLSAWAVNTGAGVVPFACRCPFPLLSLLPVVKGSARLCENVILQCLFSLPFSDAGYEKRATFDTIFPEKLYRSVYAGLKDRHARRWVDNWPEVTDPTKFVYEVGRAPVSVSLACGCDAAFFIILLCVIVTYQYPPPIPPVSPPFLPKITIPRLLLPCQDIAIASYLIALWTHTGEYVRSSPDEPPTRAPSFIDLGCGNGLLVALLAAEGVTANAGYDVQERRIW